VDSKRNHERNGTKTVDASGLFRARGLEGGEGNLPESTGKQATEIWKGVHCGRGAPGGKKKLGPGDGEGAVEKGCILGAGAAKERRTSFWVRPEVYKCPSPKKGSGLGEERWGGEWRVIRC